VDRNDGLTCGVRWEFREVKGCGGGEGRLVETRQCTRFVLPLAIGPTISPPAPPPLRSARPLFSYAASFQGRDAHLPWTHQSSLCKLRGDKYKLSNTESGVQDNLIAASCDSDSVNHTGESKELVPIIFINHHQDGFLYASPFLLPRLNNDAGRRISFRHILEEVWR
jgi:hypothetical protein